MAFPKKTALFLVLALLIFGCLDAPGQLADSVKKGVDKDLSSLNGPLAQAQAATPPAEFVEYVSENFSIRYPSDWLLSTEDFEDGKLHSFTSLGGLVGGFAVRAVEPVGSQEAFYSRDVVMDAVKQNSKAIFSRFVEEFSLASNLSNVELLSSYNTSLNGIPAIGFEFKASSNRSVLKSNLVFIFDETFTFIFFDSAAENDFDLLKPVFDKSLLSLEPKDPSLKKYDSDFFSVSYPSNWVVEQDNSTPLVLVSTGFKWKRQSSLSVVLRADSEGAELDEYADYFKPRFEEVLTDEKTGEWLVTKHIVSDSEISVKGSPARKLAVNLTYANGYAEDWLVFLIPKNNFVYVVIAEGPGLPASRKVLNEMFSSLVLKPKVPRLVDERSFKMHEDGRFSIPYPQDWSFDDSEGARLFYSPDKKANFGLVISDLGGSKDLGDYTSAFIEKTATSSMFNLVSDKITFLRGVSGREIVLRQEYAGGATVRINICKGLVL